MFLSGNEAIARGAYEAGLRVAAAYPGTPSTEILETLAKLGDIDANGRSMRKSPLKSPSAQPSAEHAASLPASTSALMSRWTL